MQTEYLLTNSSEDKSVKKISWELFKLQLQFKQYEQEYKKQKALLQGKIQSYISKHNIKDFGYKLKNSRYKVQNVVQRKVTFDIVKLEQRLNKEILDEIIIKKYEISDIDGLVKYLKSCGVNPKKFKSFLNVNKSVDQKAMNEMSELGYISTEDIEGCYTVSENEGYIKITEVDEEI